MIPQVVADVRDILTKIFNIAPDVAIKIAMALYEAGHLQEVQAVDAVSDTYLQTR